VPVPPLRPALLAALALAAAGCGGSRPAADVPLTLVDDATTVSSVSFTFPDGGPSLLVDDLRLEIATTEPPGAIAELLVGDDGVYPFDPIFLAKDVVRLRRYYVESGFPLVEVDYEVALDTADNAVDVTFLVTEGPPLLIDSVSFAGPGQAPVAPELAPEVRDDWAAFTRGVALDGGGRLGQADLLRLQSRTVSWLRNWGYAYADAGAEAFVDSTGLRADVRVKVNVGPRARFGEVRVVTADEGGGLGTLSRDAILRELPFEPGDPFDASALTEGQREVFGLGLFQLAVVDVAPDQAFGDETVDVVVRVRRGPPRVLTGFLGYFSDGGVTARAGATHRNAFGGARTAGVDLEARTGLLGAPGQAIDGGPITDYRATLTFRQPYVLDRRLSYTLQPSFRRRNDEIEASEQYEVANTLLFTQAQLRTAALSLTGRYRDLSRGQGLRLLDAGLLGLDPAATIRSDALTAAVVGLGLDVTWGRVDDALRPARGVVVRPSLAVAGGDVSFARARLAGTALGAVGRVGLVARATVGAVRGIAGSDPDDPADYVLLRDQLFYAGGTADVRGWGGARLGPKTIAVTPPATSDEPNPPLDAATIRSAGDVNYVGVGGELKASASVQANLPLPAVPFFGPNLSGVAFLDAGRVWAPSDVPTDDLLRTSGSAADATLADLLDEEDAVRFGTGAGLQYLSPVGAISVAVGFKLNPSTLDLVPAAVLYCGTSIEDADDPRCFGGDEIDSPGEGAARGYLDARLSGSDFDPSLLPERFFQRFQFHIAIGQTF
jgi:outer membrane protein insertion porin family